MPAAVKALNKYVQAATGYAEGVVAGRISVCRFVVRAAERFLSDLRRKDLTFRTDKAAEVCAFIERLRHVKGKWAGQPMVLEPWQCFILVNAFGFYRADGLRRFRTVYIEVPRKNAKSTLSSGVGLYMLTQDGEAGAEVYSAATTRDQAKIVFSVAQSMARKDAAFQEHYGVTVLAHSLVRRDDDSKFEPLSAEGSTLDGLNIHCGVVDELHAHKTRAVYDVLETATGARTQPLLWNITTAGSDRTGVCYEQRSYLLKILDGAVEDDSYFGIVYTLDDGDDWTSEDAWRKANPNYGVSVFPDDIARLCTKAQQMPSAQNNFLTKRLDLWVNADVAWMDMRAWDACADPTLDEADFQGEECIEGLDLASKIDIAARLKVFARDGHYYAFGTYYLPEETVEDAGNSQYKGWALEGRLTVTGGNVIDLDLIESDILADASEYALQEVAYDPFQATQLSTHLQAEGMPMVEMRPTVLNFSEPMKQLDALVRSGKFHHNGDPVLTWMVSNVVCHTDAKDNIYPRKERPENKIDGVVALIMALGRWMVREETGESYWEQKANEAA